MNLVTQYRREVLLKYIDLKNHLGLEIGPYDQPTVFKNETDIKYLDWKTREELISETHNAALIADIPETDILVRNNNYSENLNLKFDYVIANHVIEHVPNLISWFESIANLLNPNGILFCALPDSKFTFDKFRPVTSFTHFVAEYIAEIKDIPLEHHVEVELLYDDAFIGIERTLEDKLNFERIKQVIQSGQHIGLHSHVFESSVFIEAQIKPLLFMGLVDFSVVDFVEAKAERGGEMIVVFKKGYIPVQLDRRAIFPEHK